MDIVFFSESNECDIYYMETEQVAEIDTRCGLVLSPSFPSQVIPDAFNESKPRLILEMLSVKNKLPSFKNLMPKKLCTYIFCSGNLDLDQATLAKSMENQTVITTDDYSNLCVQKLTFYFHDLEFDPMTFVL